MHRAMATLLVLSASSATALAPQSQRQSLRPSLRPRAPPLSATRRGLDGKIYIGEPDFEDVADQILRGVDEAERRATGALARLLRRPQPVAIPVPANYPEYPDERKESKADQPFDRHPGADWGMDRF
ncbi:hypothetical protein M885DRAFT_512541 [Pelagophyceae sp. CCMP2097]|nr:hypothetical protein M885DRAFT_512541 [Pelagophyceae sp. CCMP2097]|mmetsp:Transcript_6117/g.19593  ORF Transcript_6117/g.19593 Transcript_6117/m.19593 type:complete len:127 (+) Transcript_6117:72-452(+)